MMESVIQEHVPYHQHLWSIHLSLNCCWESVDIMTVFIFYHELFHWISIMEWYWRFRNNIIIIRIEGEFMCYIIGIGDLYFWRMDCVKCVFHFTGFHNNIGDSGACSLREMVEDNSTLTTLDLRVILWNMGDDVFPLDCFWEELYWFIRSVVIEIRIGGEFNNHINWIGMMFWHDVYFQIWRYLCLILRLVDIQNQFHWDGYLKDCHNWHHWICICEFWRKCVLEIVFVNDFFLEWNWRFRRKCDWGRIEVQFNTYKIVSVVEELIMYDWEFDDDMINLWLFLTFIM